MNETIKKLVQLSKENPELPIVTMVIGETDGRTQVPLFGEMEEVKLGEYALFHDCFIINREYFKEQYYYHNGNELDELGYKPGINDTSFRSGYCTQEELIKNKEILKKFDAYVDEVAEKAFKKAIIITINLPEDVEDTIC